VLQYFAFARAAGFDHRFENKTVSADAKSDAESLVPDALAHRFLRVTRQFRDLSDNEIKLGVLRQGREYFSVLSYHGVGSLVT
jgi:hypothetical protein